jgi:hypothetical protein
VCTGQDREFMFNVFTYFKVSLAALHADHLFDSMLTQKREKLKKKENLQAPKFVYTCVHRKDWPYFSAK